MAAGRGPVSAGPLRESPSMVPPRFCDTNASSEINICVNATVDRLDDGMQDDFKSNLRSHRQNPGYDL